MTNPNAFPGKQPITAVELLAQFLQNAFSALVKVEDNVRGSLGANLAENPNPESEAK